jgi:hypothetical protein
MKMGQTFTADCPLPTADYFHDKCIDHCFGIRYENIGSCGLVSGFGVFHVAGAARRVRFNSATIWFAVVFPPSALTNNRDEP